VFSVARKLSLTSMSRRVLQFGGFVVGAGLGCLVFPWQNSVPFWRWRPHNFWTGAATCPLPTELGVALVVGLALVLSWVGGATRRRENAVSTSCSFLFTRVLTVAGFVCGFGLGYRIYTWWYDSIPRWIHIGHPVPSFPKGVRAPIHKIQRKHQ